jgi:hypothetical protein
MTLICSTCGDEFEDGEKYSEVHNLARHMAQKEDHPGDTYYEAKEMVEGEMDEIKKPDPQPDNPLFESPDEPPEPEPETPDCPGCSEKMEQTEGGDTGNVVRSDGTAGRLTTDGTEHVCKDCGIMIDGDTVYRVG